MNTTNIIKDFAKNYVNDLIETNLFSVSIIEQKFDVKRVNNNSDDICLLCLENTNQEIIIYKCIKCSCHLHHSCLNNYAKSYSFNNCIQCKHLHKSVFNNIDF